MMKTFSGYILEIVTNTEWLRLICEGLNSMNSLYLFNPLRLRNRAQANNIAYRFFAVKKM